MSNGPNDVVEQLHASLDSRLAPEAVASLVLAAVGDRLPSLHRRVLDRAAGGRAAWYSSMSSEFERPVPAAHKARKLAELVGADPELALAVAGDPVRMRGELRILGPFVGWDPGVDFNQRMNRERRAAAGVQLSRRQYNRLVRHLSRFDKRLDGLERRVSLRQLLLVGRSGLAAEIRLEEMRGDVDAACFVAYWVANKNRRRRFTLDGRDNPFDEVAEMLLDRCVAGGEATDWWTIARAYPNPVVVARLDDARRGELMGRWSGYMVVAADLLRDLYGQFGGTYIEPAVPDSMWDARPGLRPSVEARGGGWREFDRSRMVVQRGMDSSTWNTVAQAYNAARAGWMNCLGAAGALQLLDVACPGKVMRLMAGDLVAMHDGAVDPDTRVWGALPLPWEVLHGDAVCTRETVEWACAEQGLDPAARGWTAPRQVGRVAVWKPTPELVHGVEVGDPLWAGLLRRAGAWSGKRTAPEVVGYLLDQGATESA